MNFYAFATDKQYAEQGDAPCGTDHQTLFELKTTNGAINRTIARFKNSGKKYATLYRYTNVYDDKTYVRIAFISL
jgi:hypothetical protein